MDANSILRHPFFKGIIVEPEDDAHRKDMERISLEHKMLQERIDSLLVTLNGEEDWMLILRKKDNGDG
jgi:hypothetical protein